MTDLAYMLGKRDMCAELFMLIRTEGKDEALKQLANELNASEAPHGNCHAVWYLSQEKMKGDS